MPHGSFLWNQTQGEPKIAHDEHLDNCHGATKAALQAAERQRKKQPLSRITDIYNVLCLVFVYLNHVLVFYFEFSSLVEHRSQYDIGIMTMNDSSHVGPF